MHWPPLPPGNAPGTHFCYRLSRLQGDSAIKRIMSMKNFKDTIWIRTSDLLICSTAPQPLCHRGPHYRYVVIRMHIQRSKLNSVIVYMFCVSQVFADEKSDFHVQMWQLFFSKINTQSTNLKHNGLYIANDIPTNERNYFPVLTSVREETD